MRRAYHEGSIDCVAMVDEETFVTGSDNGSLSLWSLQKKKPMFTVPLAHGLDPAFTPEEVSADVLPEVKIPERNPRWITALATVPLSDLVISGSWDGYLRVWQVSEDKRRLERVGVVRTDGKNDKDRGIEGEGLEAEGEQRLIEGIVNDVSLFETGEKEKEKSLCVVAGIGTELRLGRWKTVKGKNGTLVFEISKTSSVGGISESGEMEVDTKEK